MNTLQDLGSWGSNLLGQAQTQLRPAAAAAAGIASSGLQRGTDLVQTGAKSLRRSITENLSTHFGPGHVFQDSTGDLRTVYEVCHIAEGAFGAVVKVTDPKTGDVYALKKIACQEGVQVASSLEAAKREAQILRSLPPHPNIVHCLGCSTERTPGGSTVKLLMELCCGGHLLDFMDSKNGSLKPKEIMEPFMQVVDAVCHLHKQRPPIQHRDLKVENVLLGSDGVWKLCDFGSCSTETVPAQELNRAALLHLQEEIDKTVTMLYRPPEMADIELNFRKGYAINEQVDVWMLGCILYTLAFYRHPFQDNATAMAISNAKYFIPNDHPMAASQKLCSLIHWLLAGDPKDRPATKALAELLRGFGRCTLEELQGKLPQGVKDKMNRMQALFGSRKADDGDMIIPPDACDISPSKPQRRSQQQPQQRRERQQPPQSQQQPPKQAPKQAAATPPLNTNDDGFDLRFALAPEAAAGLSGSNVKPSSALAHAKSAPAAIEAAANEDEDLLSFGNPSGGGVAAAAQPQTNLGIDDLLDFSGTAPAPANRQPAPACDDADWCDFASFGEPPAPVSPATVGGASFGDQPSPASPTPVGNAPFGIQPQQIAAPGVGVLFGSQQPAIPAAAVFGGAASLGQPTIQPSRTAPPGQLGGFDDGFTEFASAAPLSAQQPGLQVLAGSSQGRRSLPAAAPMVFPTPGPALPERSISTPAMGVEFRPFPPAQQTGTPCGQAARAKGPVEGSTGTAAADLSAMVSQQVNLLDL